MKCDLPQITCAGYSTYLTSQLIPKGAVMSGVKSSRFIPQQEVVTQVRSITDAETQLQEHDILPDVSHVYKKNTLSL